MKRKSLDCRGLLCPLPVLEAAKALKKLTPPFILTVISDDPVAPRDFRAFAKQRKLRLEIGPFSFRLSRARIPG